MAALLEAWLVADVLTFMICMAWAAQDRVDEYDMRGANRLMAICIVFAVPALIGMALQ